MWEQLHCPTVLGGRSHEFHWLHWYLPHLMLLTCCSELLYHQLSLLLMSPQIALSHWKLMTYDYCCWLCIDTDVYIVPWCLEGPFNSLQWICLLLIASVLCEWQGLTSKLSTPTLKIDLEKKKEKNCVSILGRLMNVTLSALIAGCPASAAVIIPSFCL